MITAFTAISSIVLAARREGRINIILEMVLETLRQPQLVNLTPVPSRLGEVGYTTVQQQPDQETGERSRLSSTGHRALWMPS